MATTYYHVTTVWNVNGIQARGLLTSKSRGRRKAVWFCTKAKVEWAIVHVMQTHFADLYSVVVLPIKAPAGAKKSGRPGLWYTESDVPASRIDFANTPLGVEWR